ncbi:hypothetical protein [Leucobacter iarius]|uniref:Uncharacterized protein n=1 Tax=Leucobacter iarius TaxID=333963 RepID=A0ABN2LDR5_9MICO
MEDEVRPSEFYKDPGFVLLSGPFAVTVPVVVQLGVMAFTIPGFQPYSLKAGFAFLCIPSLVLGLGLSVLCLCLWRIRASPPGTASAYLRACAIGVVVGVLGAYPVGQLGASTTLARGMNFDESWSILISGVYLALVFTGHMLWWERREASKHRSLRAERLAAKPVE